MIALFFWGILIGVSLLMSFLSWVYKLYRESKKHDNLNARDLKLVSDESALKKKQSEWEGKLRSDLDAIEHIIKEKSLGFPWLAKAFSDYYELMDLKIARNMEAKSHPAQKSADKVRGLSREKKQLMQEYRVAKYFLEYYENLFPWLVDFRGGRPR